jgi:NAD(P)-dependent dehydrogenase (short-subunit alcohol dehydrogenase family)/acyl carrier protein
VPRLAPQPLPESPPVRADGTYLVTGGLGGAGLLCARALATAGARQLVLVGRTATPECAAVRELEALGARVRVEALDVADERAVGVLLDGLDGPPLRGVLHAAGVAVDGLATALDRAALERALRPKLGGGLALHRALGDRPLDFFVLFSSLGSLLGHPGQGAYAAANAFLDALAHARRAQGRPAVSVNWAVWDGVGLAATPGGRRAGATLADAGIRPIATAEALDALWRVTAAGEPQLAVGDLLGARGAAPVLARPAQAPAARDVREALAAAEPGAVRRAVMRRHLQEQVGQVLRVAPDEVAVSRPLKSLGLDSIAALELRSRLEASLGLALPAALAWHHPTLADLGVHLSVRLGLPLEPPPTEEAGVAAARADGGDVLEEIDRLSDDEIRRLLTGSDSEAGR